MVKFFIELNRSFVEIPKDHTFNEEDYDVSIAFGLLETKKWENLLQLHRVIILAEAGAGKTEEVRAATNRLRNDGNKAFFLRLEHLGSDFESSFEIGNNAEFNEWVASDEPGWFFLDSVDEARLCGPRQFEASIRKLGDKLGDSKQRAHIYNRIYGVGFDGPVTKRHTGSIRKQMKTWIFTDWFLSLRRRQKKSPPKTIKSNQSR